MRSVDGVRQPGRQAGIAEPGRALPGEHVHLAGPEITDVHDDRVGQAGRARLAGCARGAPAVAAAAGAARVPANAAAARPAPARPAAPDRTDRRDGPGRGAPFAGASGD